MVIFLSYSRKDINTARELKSNLEKYDMEVFIDENFINPSATWRESIIKHIKKSDFLIVLLSTSSCNSPNVKREVSIAVDNNIKILPVRIENIVVSGEMEYLVSSFQYLDIFHNLQSGIDDMISILDGGNSKIAISSNSRADILKDERREKPIKQTKIFNNTPRSNSILVSFFLHFIGSILSFRPLIYLLRKANNLLFLLFVCLIISDFFFIKIEHMRHIYYLYGLYFCIYLIASFLRRKIMRKL